MLVVAVVAVAAAVAAAVVSEVVVVAAVAAAVVLEVVVVAVAVAAVARDTTPSKVPRGCDHLECLIVIYIINKPLFIFITIITRLRPPRMLNPYLYYKQPLFIIKTIFLVSLCAS